MEIFSILLRSFGEKDTEKILKIIGIPFQYFFNISVPSIVQCIQCLHVSTKYIIIHILIFILTAVVEMLTLPSCHTCILCGLIRDWLSKDPLGLIL